MPRNSELSNLVLGKLFDLLKCKEPKLKGLERKEGIEFLSTNSTLYVDTRKKFLAVSNYITVCAYDLSVDYEGERAQITFDRVISKYQQFYSGKNGFGNLVDFGTTEKYGWYVLENTNHINYPK